MIPVKIKSSSKILAFMVRLIYFNGLLILRIPWKPCQFKSSLFLPLLSIFFLGQIFVSYQSGPVMLVQKTYVQCCFQASCYLEVELCAGILILHH